MSAPLIFGKYDSGLGREPVLRIGAGEGDPCLLILPPLFDEMHKLRRTLVLAMRALADRGIASILPDLPGLNESQTPLSQCQLADWQKAMRWAAGDLDATHVASLRSACVLDEGLRELPRWRYAPVTGVRLITQMTRAQMAGNKAVGRAAERLDFDDLGADAVVSLVGYNLHGAMLSGLKSATVKPLRQNTDRLVETSLGPPLWLRAEPGESAELAHALADSWAKWMAA